MKETMMARGKTIISELLEVMAARPGKVLTSEQVMKAAKMNNVKHVRNSLTAYVRNHPSGPVERISSGLFRFHDEMPAPVSAQPASYPPGDMAKTIAANHAIVDEAALNGQITAADGWVAPSDDFLDVPAFSIKRGGATFPPPLAAGLKLDDATVAHVGPTNEDGSNDVYFTWRGKMWKAYQI